MELCNNKEKNDALSKITAENRRKCLDKTIRVQYNADITLLYAYSFFGRCSALAVQTKYKRFFRGRAADICPENYKPLPGMKGGIDCPGPVWTADVLFFYIPM